MPQERPSHHEQRWAPREQPSIIIRRPSTILGAVSPPSSPHPPRSPSQSFPRLGAVIRERNDHFKSSVQRDMRETKAGDTKEPKETDSFDEGTLGLKDASSPIRELGSSRITTPKPQSLVQTAPIRRSGSEGCASSTLIDTSATPLAQTLSSQGNPADPHPLSPLGHRRRGSTTDAYLHNGSPPSFLTSTSYYRHLESATSCPPSPPPFTDFINSVPATPQPHPHASFSRPSMGMRSKSHGSVVGKLKKKASITFRSATGAGADGPRAQPHFLPAYAESFGYSSTKHRATAACSDPQTHEFGRPNVPAGARPPLQAIDVTTPGVITPLAPIESATNGPRYSRTNVIEEAAPLGRTPSKSRRRTNTAHGESRGLLSNLLKLKKSTATLRGDRTPSPRTPPPPLPLDLPVTSLRPRSQTQGSAIAGQISTESGGNEPYALHISASTSRRSLGGGTRSPAGSRASSRSRRQDPSNESLPLTSSSPSSSWLAHSSSDGFSSTTSARPSFSERRRAASSTKSATSARSYHTFSDQGHGGSLQEHDQLPLRREARGEEPPGSRIAEFGELVRALPKSSNASSVNTVSSLSTVDSRSPYPTALSPPPRRPPRVRPSPTSSLISSSPNGSISLASETEAPLYSPAMPDRPPKSPSRPSMTSAQHS